MTLQTLQEQQKIHNTLAKGWDVLNVIEDEDEADEFEDEADLVYGLDDEPAHPITEQDLLDVMGPDDNDEIDSERNTVTAELRRGGGRKGPNLGKLLLAEKHARQKRKEVQNTNDAATVSAPRLEDLQPLTGGIDAMQLYKVDVATLINPNRVQPILASFKNALTSAACQTLVQQRIAAIHAKLNTQPSIKKS